MLTVRRLVPPIIILAVASGLAWWGTRLERGRLEQAEAYVARLLDPAQRLPGDLPPGCPQRLEAIRSGAAGPGTVVHGEDRSPYADGSADASALIEVAGRAVLGLRLARESDPPRYRVVGCWDPTE